jgi:HD-GYP domain-containing protein (c-di-GMP phosphodiesterase class II)
VDLASGDPSKGRGENASRRRKGDEIPIYGRIVAVADVYDALTHRRVYKAAWKEKDVLEEMKSQAGKKFDPELVDIFFEALPHLKNITAKYPD